MSTDTCASCGQRRIVMVVLVDSHGEEWALCVECYASPTREIHRSAAKGSRKR